MDLCGKIGQCRNTGCKKSSIQPQGADSEGDCVCEEQESVPFAQFDCKPTTTRQNEAHLTGKKTKHELLIG